MATSSRRSWRTPLGPFDVADILLGALDARLRLRDRQAVRHNERGSPCLFRIGGIAAILGATSLAAAWFLGAGLVQVEDAIAWTLLVGLVFLLVGVAASAHSRRGCTRACPRAAFGLLRGRHGHCRDRLRRFIARPRSGSGSGVPGDPDRDVRNAPVRDRDLSSRSTVARRSAPACRRSSHPLRRDDHEPAPLRGPWHLICFLARLVPARCPGDPPRPAGHGRQPSLTISAARSASWAAIAARTHGARHPRPSAP